MSSDSSSHHHPYHGKLYDSKGKVLYTNALAHETSPYLLQHAHNPVNWHSWGPEAFDLAKRQNKPIFLSIGYSTCYWCHVMERQSFENPAVAQLMNEHFVNIKVDREERPDIDDIYMAAVQAFSGSGGWPMSVFLTPPEAEPDDEVGLKPFFAGTYYPPEAGHGRPSFTELLTTISDAWKTKRDELLKQAVQLADAVEQHLTQQHQSVSLDQQTIQDAANQLLRSYDAQHGGFGNAPKFPTPNNLLLLLKVNENNPSTALRQAIDHTLDTMARGGIYDQIAGGFHRYSTDAKWLVPHFEKMLYDNAQLIELYLQAAVPDRASANASDAGQYHRIARQSCDYVLREMVDPTGGFWSAQDAEVDASEGANYVWTTAQLREAIDDDFLSGVAEKMYGLDQGPNFKDPHDPHAGPANVLYLPNSLPKLAREMRVDLDEMVQLKRSIDQRLIETRQNRKQPGTDDKVLTPWNGMMIAALARAGRNLDSTKYTEAAAKAARYILDRMRTEDGGLYRTMRHGRAKIPAFLEGYTSMVHGLIELYRTHQKAHWLNAASALTRLAYEKFADPQGGYFDSLDGQTDLLVRTRTAYDGAIPCGNSQMVHNLIDLYEISGNTKSMDQAQKDLESFGAQLARQGMGMAHMQHALLRAIEHRPEMLEAAKADAASPGAFPPGQRKVVSVDVEPKLFDLKFAPINATITLNIEPDYHLNASQLNDQSLIPTTLELLDAPGLELKVKYPKGQSRRYPMSDQPLEVYEGKVEIQAVVRVMDNVDPKASPRLVLSYQVCTDQSCLEPRSVELPVEFANLSEL